MSWLLRLLGRVPVRRWERTPVHVEPYDVNGEAFESLVRAIQTINVVAGHTLLVLRNPTPRGFEVLPGAIAIVPIDKQVAPASTLLTENVAKGRIKAATIYVSMRAVKLGDLTDAHLYDALVMALGSPPGRPLSRLYK